MRLLEEAERQRGTASLERGVSDVQEHLDSEPRRTVPAAAAGCEVSEVQTRKFRPVMADASTQANLLDMTLSETSPPPMDLGPAHFDAVSVGSPSSAGSRSPGKTRLAHGELSPMAKSKSAAGDLSPTTAARRAALEHENGLHSDRSRRSSAVSQDGSKRTPGRRGSIISGRRESIGTGRSRKLSRSSSRGARLSTGSLASDTDTFNTSGDESDEEDSHPLRVVYHSFLQSGQRTARNRVIIAALEARGLLRDDARMEQAVKQLSGNDTSTFREFEELVGDNQLVERAFANKLAIPQFEEFTGHLQRIVQQTEDNRDGTPADYIPQLACVNPNQYGMGVCTIDGQRYACGDKNTRFCVQSCTKPLAYAMALEQHGERKVHSHVGREPSGRGFNERVLNPRDRPHNPMVNAGAIMVSSLVRPEMHISDRWDHVMDLWSKLAGGRRPSFANSVYLSESATADRNWCLSYMMQEVGAFPEGTDLKDALEFYFMLCSIEVDAEMMSIVAATLANGGVCPLTGERVFNSRTVRNTLSLMGSCGMYDASGEFAFRMGFPCKSGVGGSLCIVIPGVAGLCAWSPALDKFGNSVRGQDFCRSLVEIFAFHMLDGKGALTAQGKIDPRFAKNQLKRTEEAAAADAAGTGVDGEDLVGMWYSAANGQLLRLKQLVSRGLWVDESDYDGRTAIHLAASEGHLDCLQYLINVGAELSPVDRFGFTPLEDAMREDRTECIELLQQKLQEEEERSRGRRVASEDVAYMDLCIDEPDKQALIYAFRHIYISGDGQSTKAELVAAVVGAGLSQDDPRLVAVLAALPETFSCQQWVETVLKHPAPALVAALTGRLVIPDFVDYVKNNIDMHTVVTEEVPQGQVVSGYHEAGQAEDAFGVATCSTSGQHKGLGNFKETVVIGEIAAALNYCIAQDLCGAEYVHKYVSYEPSGRAADEIALAHDGRPHNPLVHTGALVTLSMLNPHLSTQDRFAGIKAKFAAAAGIKDLSNSQQFIQNRPNADRNHCLIYMLQEKGCFPKEATDRDLIKNTMDLFYMTESVLMSCDHLAVVASTLANGGVCPITNERVFSQESVRNCLALMFSCGCDSYSGEFAFRVGIPAKSSSSGCTLLVCPGAVGSCVWSPKLNENHCSARGVAFAHLLVSRYSFHAFETGAIGLGAITATESGSVAGVTGGGDPSSSATSAQEVREKRMDRITRLAQVTDEERLLMKAGITSLTDPTVHPTAAYESSVSAALLAASTGDLVRLIRLLSSLLSHQCYVLLTH